MVKKDRKFQTGNERKFNFLLKSDKEAKIKNCFPEDKNSNLRIKNPVDILK